MIKKGFIVLVQQGHGAEALSEHVNNAGWLQQAVSIIFHFKNYKPRMLGQGCRFFSVYRKGMLKWK